MLTSSSPNPCPLEINTLCPFSTLGCTGINTLCQESVIKKHLVLALGFVPQPVELFTPTVREWCGGCAQHIPH